MKIYKILSGTKEGKYEVRLVSDEALKLYPKEDFFLSFSEIEEIGTIEVYGDIDYLHDTYLEE